MDVAGRPVSGGGGVSGESNAFWTKTGSTLNPTNLACGISVLGTSDFTGGGLNVVAADFTSKRIRDTTADGEVQITKRLKILGEENELALHVDGSSFPESNVFLEESKLSISAEGDALEVRTADGFQTALSVNTDTLTVQANSAVNSLTGTLSLRNGIFEESKLDLSGTGVAVKGKITSTDGNDIGESGSVFGDVYASAYKLENAGEAATLTCDIGGTSLITPTYGQIDLSTNGVFIQPKVGEDINILNGTTYVAVTPTVTKISGDLIGVGNPDVGDSTTGRIGDVHSLSLQTKSTDTLALNIQDAAGDLVYSVDTVSSSATIQDNASRLQSKSSYTSGTFMDASVTHYDGGVPTGELLFDTNAGIKTVKLSSVGDVLLEGNELFATALTGDITLQTNSGATVVTKLKGANTPLTIEDVSGANALTMFAGNTNLSKPIMSDSGSPQDVGSSTTGRMGTVYSESEDLLNTSSGSETYPLFFKNAADVTGTAVGMRFSTSSGGHIKGGIAFKNTLSQGRGELHFMVQVDGGTGVPLTTSNSSCAKISRLGALEPGDTAGQERRNLGSTGNKWDSLHVDVANVETSVLPSNATATIGTAGAQFDYIHYNNGVLGTSQRSKKRDIQPIELGLDFIKDMSCRSYRMTKKNSKKHCGIVADELEAVLVKNGIDSTDFAAYNSTIVDETQQSVDENGELVYDDVGDPVYPDEKVLTKHEGIAYMEFIPILMKAVQELSAEVDLLKK